MIPQALKDTPQWILWRNESGKKMPYSVHGGAASSTDPSHWAAYDEAKAKLDENAGAFTGLGFVFSKEDEFFGVDLDDCHDPSTQTIAPWAQEIIDSFDTYGEVSPSGTGVKMFGKGKLPSDRGKRTKYGDGVVEMYDWGRYFAVTGDGIQEPGVECEECQEAIGEWFPKLFGSDSKEKGSLEELDVEDVSQEQLDKYIEVLRGLPDAVSGSHGSYDTMHALCEIRRCRLNAEQSWVLIDWFNDNKCFGPWDQSELERKWEGAKEMQPVRTAAEVFDDDLPPLPEDYDIMYPNDVDWSLGEMRGVEFYHKEYKVEYLVDQILAAHDCHVIGGPTKTLKTGIALDLCISIASGQPFLDRFEVLKPGPVLFCSGESGEARLNETYKSICIARGLQGHDDFIIAPTVPRLDQAGHVREMRRKIKYYGCVYCLVDPAYLSVGAGTNGDDQNNVNKMGTILSRFNSLGYGEGCTMALCHHYTKGAAKGKTLSHTNLAGAGYAEWCRQWTILLRDKTYRHDGHHDIRMAVGGSAGHGADYALHVYEGYNPATTRAGGEWVVDVSQEGLAALGDLDAAEDEETIIDAIREITKAGRVATAKQIRESAKVHQRHLDDLLPELVAAGKIAKGVEKVQGHDRDAYTLDVGAIL